MKISKERLTAFTKSARTRIVAAIVLTLICTGTVFAATLSIYTVEIIADGESKVIQTSQTDANEIVAKGGFTLGEKDELDVSNFKPGENVENNKIIVLRAHNITIDDDGEKTNVVIAALTVGDALKRAGVDVSKFDKVTPSLKAKVKEGMTIEIKRAYVIEVIADGETKPINFVEGTVADALELASIKLEENDEIYPSLDTKLKSGDEITVKRVSYQTREVKETIKFSTVSKRTATLYSGQRQTEQAGVNGEKMVTYTDKIVDGKTVSSKAVSTQVLKEPVNCIKLIGTKVKVLSARAPISAIPLPSRFALDADGIPTAIKDTITGVAKSYTCNVSSYKGSGGTASGVKAQSGYIAVNPKQIPYGTEMYIVSSDGKYVYGYCIAADTGGFAKQGTAVCDLYMDTLNECRQWGSRNVNIYILNWGNGRVA